MNVCAAEAASIGLLPCVSAMRAVGIEQIRWRLYPLGQINSKHATRAGQNAQGMRANYARLMAGKPLLFIDVDGVLSVYGFDGENVDPRDFHLVDGIPHHIPASMGSRVRRVLPAYESLWATGWGDRANDHLVHMLGLPGELEVIEFATRPSTDGSGHWKLEELTERAGELPAAWIDDGHNPACEAWAASRSAPTLLVSTDPYVGMTDAHVEELLEWSAAVSPSAW